MRALVALGLAALASVSGAQRLFHGSETAGPGDPVSVVGDGLSGSTLYRVVSYPTGRTATVPATSTTPSVALLTLPSTLPKGMFRIVAVNGGKGGNPLFVNRPRLEWLDEPSAMPGQEIRAVGRNLKVGSTPTVLLSNLATRARAHAAVVAANPGMVRFRIPAGLPAGEYKVTLNNGLAGLASEGADALGLAVLPARTDPLALGVSWGADVPSAVYPVADPRLPAHPVGDGATEDGTAIAADLAWVTDHGGGTLLLEAKTYRIDKGDDWLQVHSGTVLRGAGMGQTTLQLGYVSTERFHCPLTLWGENSLPEGIADLTVQNVNPGAAAGGGEPSQLLNVYGGTPSRAFLKRVEFIEGNGQTVDLSHIRGMVIDGCRFTAISMTSPAINLGDVQYLRYTNNVEYHRAGRFRLAYSDHVVIERSRIEFDNDYRSDGTAGMTRTAETGCVESNFNQRLLVEDCDLGARGSLPNRVATDGEIFVAQIAEAGEAHLTGGILGATPTRITSAVPIPAALTDPNNPSPTGRTGVYIVAGKGQGQHRLVTAHTASTLDVDSPWTVVPDATSVFATESRLEYQCTVEGNRLYNGFHGIEFTYGAIDCAVLGNTLTNTEGIWVQGYIASAASWGAPGSNVSFTPCWHNDVSGNSLVNGNGRKANISLDAFSRTGDDPGPMLLGNDARGNRIVGNGSPPTGNADYGSNDGIEIVAIHEYPLENPTPNAILQQGTALSGNVVTNSSLPFRNHNVAASGFAATWPPAP